MHHTIRRFSVTLKTFLLIAVLSVTFFYSPLTALAVAESPFKYYFGFPGVLYEAGSLRVTTSPYWWLNSGAALTISEGRGFTVQGKLPEFSQWRLIYAQNNPVDTDNGYYPQNIFRLVLNGQFQNFAQQAYFKIVDNNLSSSPNRNQSNGLLLFNRYQDSDNLYYAGIRVDGTAVIKKKKNGSYYTLAQEPIFPGTYNRSSGTNLLPQQTWLGVKSVVTTNADQSVRIDVYLDKNWTGRWTHILSATDDGRSYGGAAILAAGFGGIRTDFMDVMFDQYAIIAV